MAASGGLHGIGDSLYAPFGGPDGDHIDYEAYRALVRYCVGDLGHALPGAPRVLHPLLVAALPALTSSSAYRLTQYEYIPALVVLAVSLNMITGFAGQLALGPSAVFAVSGYATAVVANHFPSETGLVVMAVVGCAGGALTGLVIGLPSLRVGGFYLAMVTLFAALTVPVVAGQMQLTGGSSGISLIANIQFNRHLNGWSLYEACVGVTIVVVLASAALLHSRCWRTCCRPWTPTRACWTSPRRSGSRQAAGGTRPPAPGHETPLRSRESRSGRTRSPSTCRTGPAGSWRWPGPAAAPPLRSA